SVRPMCCETRLHLLDVMLALWVVHRSSLYYGHGSHRHLHSFPTRRSSDLSFPASAARTIARVMPRRMRCPTPCGTAHPPGHHARSEEHTSELQSRVELVCRLLLEKNNNRYGANGWVSIPTQCTEYCIDERC